MGIKKILELTIREELEREGYKVKTGKMDSIFKSLKSDKRGKEIIMDFIPGFNMANSFEIWKNFKHEDKLQFYNRIYIMRALEKVKDNRNAFDSTTSENIIISETKYFKIKFFNKEIEIFNKNNEGTFKWSSLGSEGMDNLLEIDSEEFDDLIAGLYDISDSISYSEKIEEYRLLKCFICGIIENKIKENSLKNDKKEKRKQDLRNQKDFLMEEKLKKQ